MDTKKVLEQLVRIADKQQKIINKLAQDLPQHLQPGKVQKAPAKALYDALQPEVKSAISDLAARGTDMLIRFHPGKGTQQVYDAVLSTLQTLTNQNVIQQAYTLKAV
jgi:hypothetical protein